MNILSTCQGSTAVVCTAKKKTLYTLRQVRMYSTHKYTFWCYKIISDRTEHSWKHVLTVSQVVGSLEETHGPESKWHHPQNTHNQQQGTH